jgi:hypothetical protein
VKKILVLALLLLTACGRDSGPVRLTITRINKGEDKSTYYVLKGPHTVGLLDDGSTIIVPGELGEPGDVITLARLHQMTMYGPK